MAIMMLGYHCWNPHFRDGGFHIMDVFVPSRILC